MLRLKHIERAINDQQPTGSDAFGDASDPFRMSWVLHAHNLDAALAQGHIEELLLRQDLLHAPQR